VVLDGSLMGSGVSQGLGDGVICLRICFKGVHYSTSDSALSS